MKTQRNFLGELFQRIFSKVDLFSKEISQESFVESAVKNFIAGVGYFAQKTKKNEQDPRKKFCHYPSA